MWVMIERIANDEWLLGMDYNERLHKLVVPHAEAVRNTSDFEANVLMRVLDLQI